MKTGNIEFELWHENSNNKDPLGRFTVPIELESSKNSNLLDQISKLENDQDKFDLLRKLEIEKNAFKEAYNEYITNNEDKIIYPWGIDREGWDFIFCYHTGLNTDTIQFSYNFHLDSGYKDDAGKEIDGYTLFSDFVAENSIVVGKWTDSEFAWNEDMERKFK